MTNEDLRKAYDETGMVVTEDGLVSFGNFDESMNYWRGLFPKITTKQIDEFLDNYRGSKEEQNDLKLFYNKFEGDMNKIYEYHYGFDDEQRITDLLNEMIASEDIPAYDAFTKESKKSKLKRQRKIEKERKEAEEISNNESGGDGSSDLILAIQANRQKNFDSMISNLEAKYSKMSKPNKKKRV